MCFFISVNKGLNKLTYASSEVGRNFSSQNALDNVDSTCFKSLYENNAWWMVDLLQQYSISGIYVLTTSDKAGKAIIYAASLM